MDLHGLEISAKWHDNNVNLIAFAGGKPPSVNIGGPLPPVPMILIYIVFYMCRLKGATVL